MHSPRKVRVAAELLLETRCADLRLDEFVLIEEYMEHDLAGLMHSKKRFNEPQIKCIMHQLISGLAECHEIGLIHRDMKSMPRLHSKLGSLFSFRVLGSNILMHQGNLRITDFGFMTTVENAARYHSHEIITLWYRPPELLLGTKTYGQEVDIWSVGYVASIREHWANPAH